MEIVSSADLTISYDGDALRSGLMDVRELAPALLATGTLLQKANRILNGERTDVSLKVRGEFKQGSFHVDFVVDQGLLEAAKSFLQQHPTIKDAKDVLEIVFFYAAPGVSLFKFIKWLKKRKLEANQIIFQNNGDVSIRIGDDTTIVPESVYKLYSDTEARQSAEIMVSPLKREGIEKLEIKEGDRTETVTNEQEPYFEFEIPEGDAALDTTSDALLEIVRLSFNQEHKWGFTDGDRSFNAILEDEDFWERIDTRQVAFAEGDQILARLRTETFRTPGGLRSRHTIKKVLRFIPKPKNLDFGFK